MQQQSTCTWQTTASGTSRWRLQTTRTALALLPSIWTGRCAGPRGEQGLADAVLASLSRQGDGHGRGVPVAAARGAAQRCRGGGRHNRGDGDRRLLSTGEPALHLPFAMLAGDSYPRRFRRELARCQCSGSAEVRLGMAWQIRGAAVVQARRCCGCEVRFLTVTRGGKTDVVHGDSTRAAESRVRGRGAPRGQRGIPMPWRSRSAYISPALSSERSR